APPPAPVLGAPPTLGGGAAGASATGVSPVQPGLAPAEVVGAVVGLCPALTDALGAVLDACVCCGDWSYSPARCSADSRWPAAAAATPGAPAGPGAPPPPPRHVRGTASAWALQTAALAAQLVSTLLELTHADVAMPAAEAEGGGPAAAVDAGARLAAL